MQRIIFAVSSVIVFKRLYLFVISFICISQTANSQDIIVDNILHDLQRSQVKKDSFYYKGMFTSYRSSAKRPTVVVGDNNIFFTALVAFTLRDMLPLMTTRQQQKAIAIIEETRSSYRYFKHKDKHSYNFWPKYPPVVFPHSPWERFSRTQALPDDLDDTSIILAALPVEDSIALRIKQLMQAHANGVENTIKNTARRYRHSPSYSTWFGKKMPIDFDIAVHCNILFFVHTYGLPLNATDSATTSLVAEMVREKEYMERPSAISPHYGTSALIIYHLSRLMGKFKIPALEMYRAQLLDDTYKLLGRVKDPMEKIMLATSVLKFGGTLQKEQLVAAESVLTNNDDLAFFRASFSAMLPGVLRKLLSGWPAINFRFFSPAFNDVLVMEYVLLLKNAKPS